MQSITSLNPARLSALSPLRGRLALSALAAAAALTLAACGGGGSGSSNASTSGGQATTAATYSGAVSGLGSIVVNGVRFSTSGARATDAETEGTYARAFALGTTVSVSGDVDDNSATATASSITVYGGVRGAVSAVDTTASTLTVAGQVIKVDANTVFEINGTAQTLAGLQTLVVAGTTYVEVYVVGDAASGFLATRVEQKAAIADGYAVIGKATSVTSTSFNLVLRKPSASPTVTVTVNYDASKVRPAGVTITEGTAVRVILPASTDFSTVADGSALTATKVIVKRDRAITGRAKVRGAVTAVNASAKTLMVNDVTVDVSQAKFDDGLTLAGLTVGTVLKVEGTFTNGVLVAREVEADGREYATAGGVKLYGVVSGSTPASGAAPATFSVQGVTLTLPAPNPPSNQPLALPVDGTYVEVVARMNSGVLTVERIGSDDRNAPRSFELYGTTPCRNGSSDLMMPSFLLALRNGTTTTVDGRSAVITLENGVDSMTTSLGTVQNPAQCFIEVKGAVTSTNTVTATRIEVKARTVPAAN